MGVGELRDAFNTVAEPRYTATKAYLSYEFSHDVQHQRLTFTGVDSDGKPFECKSDLLRPETHLTQAAADTARTFLTRITP